MSAPAPAVGGLQALIVRGIAWKAVSQLVVQVSRVAVGVTLARLLSPHDYGLAGMVLVFSSLVIVFSDLALGAALVQRRTVSDADCSTVFWTGAAAGTILTLAGIAASGPVADFYGQPSVRPLFAALSLSFLVTSLGATQRALLTREMNFRSLELRLMAGTLAGGAVGITAAARGYGAWAIIGQQLTIAVVSTAVLWASSPWRPGFSFSLASLRRLGGFSGRLFGQRLIYYVQQNSDSLLIGRFLGPAALGAYALAFNLLLVPFTQIAVPLAEVLFPAFSRMQEDSKRMAAAWVRATALVGFISVPSLLGLVVVAPDFVPVVLGQHWRAATPVIQILAAVGLVQSLQTLNASILQALDKTSTLLGYTIVFSVANIAAIVIGLRWGIVGVATCYALAATLVEPLYNWLTARALGASPWLVVRGLAGVLQAAAVMVAVLLAARGLLLHTTIAPSGRLVILVLLGASVYLPIAAWRAPEALGEVRELRARRRASAAPRLSEG